MGKRLVGFVLLTLAVAVLAKPCAAANERVGVNASFDDLTRALIEYLGNADFGTIRVEVDVDAIFATEPPNFGPVDRAITAIHEMGVEVLPVLGFAPGDVKVIGARLRAIFARYKTALPAYQLLDNINYTMGISTEWYSDVARSAKLSLIAANPKAKLVCGGIKGFDLPFVKALADHGAFSSLDAIAFDLYPRPGVVERPSVRKPEGGADTSAYQNDIGRYQEVRDTLAGLKLPIWVTALGYATGMPPFGSDQVAQASFLTRGVISLTALGAEKVFVEGALDAADETSVEPTAHLGLIDSAHVPKASYYAFRTLNRTLEGASLVTDVPQYSFASLFPAKDDPVYTAFYTQGTKVLMLYWTPVLSYMDRKTGVMIFDKTIVPGDGFGLLDDNPTKLKYNMGGNFVLIVDLPLSQIPSVVTFERITAGG